MNGIASSTFPRLRLARATRTTLLAAALLLPLAAAHGQESQPETAPVVLDGVELFRLRGTSGYPATERAADVRHRIITVGRDRSIDPGALRVEASDFGPRITVGDGSLTIVVASESDAALEALSQHELAQLHLRSIRVAIAEYRELRSPRRLLRSGIWVVVATVLLVVLWILVGWTFRRLDRLIGRRLEAGVERLRIQSFRLLSAERTWHLLRSLLRALRAAVLLSLIYAYVNSTLGLFPWTRGFAAEMLDLVLHPLVTIGRTALATIPDLAFLAVLALVTRLVLRLVRSFFVEIERGAVSFESFDPDWAMPTYRLVRLLIIAFAIVVAFPYIPGSNTGAFKGVSLFVGVLVSLGSSSIIGNVIAGYTMTYRRAFRDGDVIQVGDILGQVTHTRLLVTNVRTPKNIDVVIPNSLILSSHVMNYSALARDDGLILHTKVGIGYEVPWRQVEAMLRAAAGRTEGLLTDPAPFVLQSALGDFAVTYELNTYCNQP
ncbi:MAG TPA: mechanosensitive ion channel domain-containing protein, partial [Candidatus Polarisedimenticolaceae bacterium]|nr:mechanosensitive ion channel domain-containing protein [Candidatus Polarisedimenticolaceae bacterium]